MASVNEQSTANKTRITLHYHVAPKPANPKKIVKDSVKVPVVLSDWASI